MTLHPLRTSAVTLRRLLSCCALPLALAALPGCTGGDGGGGSGGSGGGGGSDAGPGAGCTRDGDCAANQYCDTSGGRALTAAPIGQSTHNQSAECLAQCVPDCEAGGGDDCQAQCEGLCAAFEACFPVCEAMCGDDDDCFDGCVDDCIDGGPAPEPEPTPEPSPDPAPAADPEPEAPAASGVCRDRAAAEPEPAPDPEPEAPAPIDWSGNWTVDLSYDVSCEQGFNDVRMATNSHTLTLNVRATADGFEATVDDHSLSGTGGETRLILSGTLPLQDNNGHPASAVTRDTMVTLRIDDVVDRSEARGTVSGTYQGRFGSDCSVEGGSVTFLR